MGVWAHPDDETMSSAGIMLSAIKNGQRVICLTATKGEEGSQDEKKWPKSKLANIREKELSYRDWETAVSAGRFERTKTKWHQD